MSNMACGKLAQPQLLLFGGFTLAGDGFATPALSRKARGLVAYLALNPRQSHSREKLAALLWGNTREQQARMNLRQGLSAIRKALPSADDPRLLADGDNVTLKLDDLDIELVKGDVCDPATAKSALDGMDAVIHLAAIVGYPACKKEPQLAHAVNVDGTANLLRHRKLRGP